MENHAFVSGNLRQQQPQQQQQPQPFSAERKRNGFVNEEKRKKHDVIDRILDTCALCYVRFPYLPIALCCVIVGVSVLICWLGANISISREFNFDAQKGFEPRGSVLAQMGITEKKVRKRECGVFDQIPVFRTDGIQRRTLNELNLTSMTKANSSSNFSANTTTPLSNKETNRNRATRSNPLTFCSLKFDLSWPIFIVESAKPKSSPSLWNFESLKAICQLEEKIYSKYPSLKSSCPFVSIPFVMTSMTSTSSPLSSSYSSCDDFTPETFSTAAAILRDCFRFFKDSSTAAIAENCCVNSHSPSCLQSPSSCLRHGVEKMCLAFQMTHFMMDKNFDPLLGVDSSSVNSSHASTSPTEQPTLRYVASSFSYYGSSRMDQLSLFVRQFVLPGHASNAHVRIGAIFSWRLYHEVFDASVMDDMRYFIIAVVLIILVIALYTKSVTLTVCTLLEVGMTLVVSFFVYRVVCGIEFFPFLNVIAIPLLVGIGADDVFILNDLWQTEKERCEVESREHEVKLEDGSKQTNDTETRKDNETNNGKGQNKQSEEITYNNDSDEDWNADTSGHVKNISISSISASITDKSKNNSNNSSVDSLVITHVPTSLANLTENSLHNINQNSQLWHRFQSPMKHVLKDAGISVFVTSLTTGCSFLASMISHLTVLKCFSLFIGLCLFVNFALMMLFIPPILVIVDICWLKCRCSRLTSSNFFVTLGQCLQFLRRCYVNLLSTVIIRGRFVTIPLLLSLAIAGAVLTFWQPRLRLPSQTPPLFRSSHPMQRLQSFYRHEFPALNPLFVSRQNQLTVKVCERRLGKETLYIYVYSYAYVNTYMCMYVRVGRRPGQRNGGPPL